MVPHSGFDLHFSVNEWCWASFHVFVSHLYSSLEKCLFSSLSHFLIGSFIFLELSCRSWMLSFKTAFSLSSFTFIKRLFSCSSLSAIRVVSSGYLGLLMFLPAILISAWTSSSPACHMMHSAYKLNKQGDSIQSWHTPFPILNQSIVPCLVLTIASWPAYRFLRRQVRWLVFPSL